MVASMNPSPIKRIWGIVLARLALLILSTTEGNGHESSASARPEDEFSSGFYKRLGVLAHLCGALDLIPVEGLAVDGAEEGLEEDD